MALSATLERFRDTEPLARARAVERGLPIAMVRNLLGDKSVTIGHLARVVAPRRTIERRLKLGQALSTEESDRLARLFGILETASDLFGGRGEAMDWLLAPKRAFDGDAPLDLIRTSAGAEAVDTLLQRARHGMLA